VEVVLASASALGYCKLVMGKYIKATMKWRQMQELQQVDSGLASALAHRSER